VRGGVSGVMLEVKAKAEDQRRVPTKDEVERVLDLKPDRTNTWQFDTRRDGWRVRTLRQCSSASTTGGVCGVSSESDRQATMGVADLREGRGYCIRGARSTATGNK
jgi:hypothetical protein